jgi:hypothetical protein
MFIVLISQISVSGISKSAPYISFQSLQVFKIVEVHRPCEENTFNVTGV